MEIVLDYMDSVVAAALLLVGQLVLKVLGVAEQKGVVVAPQSVKNPKPHETAETLGEDPVPRRGVVNGDAFVGLALSSSSCERPRSSLRGILQAVESAGPTATLTPRPLAADLANVASPVMIDCCPPHDRR